MRKVITAIFFVFIFVFLNSQPVLAIGDEGGAAGSGHRPCVPGEFETALGCIPTKPDEFVGWFLRSAIGIGGGIAFLLIIWGAFNVITSGGNPEKLNNGKEIIVSAVSGLLMIIFSVVLLKIIGYDILGIPGFGK